MLKNAHRQNTHVKSTRDEICKAILAAEGPTLGLEGGTASTPQLLLSRLLLWRAWRGLPQTPTDWSALTFPQTYSGFEDSIMLNRDLIGA